MSGISFQDQFAQFDFDGDEDNLWIPNPNDQFEILLSKKETEKSNIFNITFSRGCKAI